MKLRLAPASLATRFHRPLRFGSRWRGHELLLRLLQVAVIVLFAAVGTQFIARSVTWGGQALAGLLN